MKLDYSYKMKSGIKGDMASVFKDFDLLDVEWLVQVFTPVAKREDLLAPSELLQIG